MKKNDLKKMLSIEDGEYKLQIDNLRYLTYTVDNDNSFLYKNEYSKKRDILTISFRIELGTHETMKDYQIIARTEKGILEEVKKYTEVYFSEVAEYFNSNKCLANNW